MYYLKIAVRLSFRRDGNSSEEPENVENQHEPIDQGGVYICTFHRQSMIGETGL